MLSIHDTVDEQNADDLLHPLIIWSVEPLDIFSIPWGHRSKRGCQIPKVEK